MKCFTYFGWFLGLLALLAGNAHAQITEPGWYQVSSPVSAPVALKDLRTNTAPIHANALLQQTLNGPDAPVAEVITPEIQALADALQHDPQQIYRYVHDHIRFVLYFGSKKGANLTLLEKSGNDFDQCALLVALLRASGYTDVQYQFGWQQMPYAAANGVDLQHWWQLTLPNTNWTTTVTYLWNLAVGHRGYPKTFYDDQFYYLQRVWVALTIKGTTYLLDPSVKVIAPVPPVLALTNALGGNLSNLLVTAAAGTNTGNYAQGLNETAVRNQLTSSTTNFLNYLQTHAPNASMAEVLGGGTIAAGSDFTTNTPFTPYEGIAPTLTWTYLPTNLMSTLTVSFGTTNYSCYLPQLQGRRLALTFDAKGGGQLWLDDTLLVSNNVGTASPTTQVTLAITYPFGSWDFDNNTLLYDPGYGANATVPNIYQSANATYALLYAFEPDWGWLRQRQNRLDAYLQQGLTNGTRQVTSESLNIMGLTWMLQTEQTGALLASQLGILEQFHHRLGRMAQEAGHGYYIDIYMQATGQYPASGDNLDLASRYFDLWSYFSSALEHGMIEQLQNTNLVAASTVKMLQIANASNQPVYLACSTNWTTGYNVRSHLTGYNGATNTIGQYINNGYYVLLPQNGANRMAGAGSWAGYGYEARLAGSGGAADSKMVISGGYQGGYASDPAAVVDTGYIYTTASSQPDYYSPTPTYTPPSIGGDPMDLANGTFQIENTDLSLGQAEPRGLTLSRYYNGARRFSRVGGLTGGWLHNYCITANQVPAPQAVLGGTTPAQAAAMLTATAAAIATYNSGQPDPKNWLTTALIAKWAVDQLDKSGVSVSLGKDTLQFVQAPNGVFIPPASSTATLTQSGKNYTLQMQHGNKFTFNANGYLTNIVDQYNQSLNLTYNTSNWVTTVKDWKNRQLTFTYSGTPQRLTSVSDGTRTVSYGYSTATSPQGDLVSFTDPEGKASTYQYDTNHQITATLDAASRLVVSNIYNSQGRVTTQYTQGDKNKTWRVYWSGWQTALFDPASGETDYFYDDAGRLIGQQDALGNRTQTFYDGQNHIIATVSPLNETNRFVFDGNNNLIQAIDPLGFTNQFVFDANNNLVKTIDPKGNASTFGYNAQFSLTGQTNGAGDWVNYTYTTSGALAGTLATKTDAGGTTSYSYDGNGYLSSLVYPNGLGTNTFVNDAYGDMTSRTDGRGFVTTFGFNNRRQLTNTIAPTNIVTKTTFDAVGNLASTTDPRGNISSFAWSATRHLLATTLPATAAGTPVVTNFYDSRDNLVKILDPYQQATLFTNDANGRLIAQTDPLQRTTRFSFDANGRKISIQNAAGETIQQQWDRRGSLVKSTDNAGHMVSRAYDAAGNQMALTNRNGKLWQFQYDGANRLVSTISPLQHSTSAAFNHQGLVASVKDPAGQTTTYNYDGKGRLTNRVDTVGTNTYSYDANDNRTSVAGNGLANTWAYDAYNRVSSYQDAYGNVIQYKYDVSGNLTNLIYPGGKNVYYSYDSQNHITQVKDWSGRTTTMTYDLAGKLTTLVRPNGTTRTLGYDKAGQVTNILEQMPNTLPIAVFRLNWNTNSTMQWEFAAPLPHNVTVPTRTMTYDADNRLATVNGTATTSDLNGNLTYAPLANGLFTTQIFDARNRLTSSGGLTNIYDAMNNRIGQRQGTNVTTFVVNPNAKLPQMLMRIKNGVTNYYIYGAGLLYQITETATTTNTLTYHYDCRGSTVAITDGNGNVTDRMEYSAYGTLTYRTGSSDTPFLFNGLYGVQSDGNGLLYMTSRYYSPYLCRFINPDPSGFAGGLNFYAYAGGNPISLIDPFGLSFWSVTGYFLEGVVIGAAVTVAVIVAAPVVAAAGAAAIVAGSEALAFVGIGAAVSAEAAATVSSAIVTIGVYGAGGYGAYQTTVSTAEAAGTASVTGNWDSVAFDAGTVAGGFVVGTTPTIFGDVSGGRAMANDMMALTGRGESKAPNTWNVSDILNYEWQNRYQPSLGAPGINYWSTSPTPLSGGFSATAIGSWVGTSATGK